MGTWIPIRKGLQVLYSSKFQIFRNLINLSPAFPKPKSEKAEIFPIKFKKAIKL